VTFYQLCTASPAAFQAMQTCIDIHARQGKAYEFADCEMPAGCTPARAALGFLRQGESYTLYWRPMVTYRGKSPVLAVLFGRNVWRFDSFQSLSARLQSLRREVEPGSGLLRGRPLPRPERRGPLWEQQRQTVSPETWPVLYRRLTEELSKAVLGQEHAVEATAFRLYAHIGKQAPARPLSLIFHGPTGVGKSELGKALAPVLERCCGKHFQFVWTELNTFTQPHSVHRLTGAPPGYVGYEDQPIFETVRRNPHTVFMFDELEKAHPEVLKVFMSILDEGRCTAHRADNGGERELDFRRCVFVFTTNADLTAAGGQRRLGFSRGETAPERRNAEKKAASPAELAERLFEENEEARRAMVRHGVLTEIAGRFSGLIGFQRLDESARLAITVKQIRALGREYGLEITAVAPETIQALAPSGDALSMRSSVSVLEGVLTPVLSQAPPGWKVFSLTGTPDRLRLVPDHCGRSSSSTELLATSSL
jgi:DNA polymerase III delta prime subunit